MPVPSLIKYVCRKCQWSMVEKIGDAVIGERVPSVCPRCGARDMEEIRPSFFDTLADRMGLKLL